MNSVTTPKSPEGDFAHLQTKTPSGDLGVKDLGVKDLRIKRVKITAPLYYSATDVDLGK